MILSTLDSIVNKKIVEHLGIVTGESVRTTSAKDDVLTGVKGLVGGEIKKATSIINETRKESTDRLVEDAKKLGAHAVLGVKYTTNSNVVGAVEIFAYGTAVKLEG